ncbi:MAG: hypothetical protein JWM22_1160, partial [Frankiales bacterium]|nr:hypothetical protein [Frankiales bacterium]
MKRPTLRALGLVVVLTATGLSVAATQSADAGGVLTTTSSVLASNGKRITVTNHLTQAAQQQLNKVRTGRHEYLLVWAGDTNVADTTGKSLQETRLSVNPVKTLNEDTDNAPAPDFLAVIDATKG